MRRRECPPKPAEIKSSDAQRVDLDAIMMRLRQGLTFGHPDIPALLFTRQDARALVAYLRAV